MKPLLFSLALLSSPSFADAPESFYVSVKAQMKNERGEKWKLKTSKMITQGERTMLGGDGHLTLEVQYDPMGENMLMSFFVLDEQRQPSSFGKVMIGQNDGAKLEVGDFQIEFWDVTKKRAEAAKAAGAAGAAGAAEK